MSGRNSIAVSLLTLCVACGSGGDGDPANGEKLHAECVGCHGTELYQADARKVKSIGELKKAVDVWNDRMSPKFTAQEVDDLVAYLNKAYYRFN